MSVVSTASLVRSARAAGVGIGAFNVITLEHAEGVLHAVERTGLPVIVQISQNAARFHGSVQPLAAAVRVLAERCAGQVALHLDHVDDGKLLHEAPQAGFSSAMFDAGHRPYSENVALTRGAAAWAHSAGLWLEAELGYVGGKPDSPASAHAPGARTDPVEASAFVAATSVDALAVAVGSSHAMTARRAELDADLIARLREAVPVPLVLHGSSGVPDEQLTAGVRAGLTKINVGTALNVAYTRAVRACLDADAGLTDPRRYLVPARSAIADEVARLLRLLVS